MIEEMVREVWIASAMGASLDRYVFLCGEDSWLVL